MMNGKSTCVGLSMLLCVCALGQFAEAAGKASSRAHVSNLRATVTRTYAGTDSIVVQDRTGFEFLIRLKDVEVTSLSRRVPARGLQSGDVVVVRGEVEPF